MNLNEIATKLKSGELVGDRIESIQLVDGTYIWKHRGFRDISVDDFKSAIDVARMILEPLE